MAVMFGRFPEVSLTPNIKTLEESDIMARLILRGDDGIKVKWSFLFHCFVVFVVAFISSFKHYINILNI